MTEGTIYARDLDGTGSMHMCAKGDTGWVEYVPVSFVEPLIAALNKIHGGNFQGAGTLATEGDWRTFVDKLQIIAGNAIDAHHFAARGEA